MERTPHSVPGETIARTLLQWMRPEHVARYLHDELDLDHRQQHAAIQAATTGGTEGDLVAHPVLAQD